MDPLTRAQLNGPDKCVSGHVCKIGTRHPEKSDRTSPRQTDAHHPAPVKKPSRDIPGRLTVAAGDVVEGTVKITKGVATTIGNGSLIIVEGVATVGVVAAGSAALAVEGVVAGTAAAAGVVVGLGVGAVELVGKGAQAIGKGAEAVGDATVKVRQGAGRLLASTATAVAALIAKGYVTIGRAFSDGVDLVSPPQ